MTDRYYRVPFNATQREIVQALNEIPFISYISTSDGPESVVSASPGSIAIDVGSSATTFWGKLSGETSTGWAAFTLA